MNLKELLPSGKKKADLRKFAQLLFTTASRIDEGKPNPLIPAKRFVTGETDPGIVETAIETLSRISTMTREAATKAAQIKQTRAETALASLASSVDTTITALRSGDRGKVGEETEKIRTSMWHAVEELDFI